MPIAFTIAMIVSWIVILFGLFLFERLQSRFVELSVQHRQLLRMQAALIEHLHVELADTEFDEEVKELLRDGRTTEAIAVVRRVLNVGYKEAKAYTDDLYQRL